MSAETFHADWIAKGEASSTTPSKAKAKSKSSQSSWQALGVAPSLVRALQLRGFKTPTPVQRASIPLTISNPPRDVLGMARTGSGKTLAYLIPLLHRLGFRREGAGIRALIMCPSRELAVQILKAGKDLSRNLATGVSDAQPLRWSLVMGGESLDAQFESIVSRPDILFEMGFEQQLHEILHRLPVNRHSLLFSATLPSSLAEFAKAGLNNPEFVRLDSDMRINPDLDLGFFHVKPDEKDAGLLLLLRDVLKIPSRAASIDADRAKAIIFASTKHHVEYLSVLLQAAGYRVSYIYGSLDQVARQQQLKRFRAAETDLLVVTDVAARGIDIPSIPHVINYDLPTGVRVFVHRVGRTARAGQHGHAWTLVTRDDLPYMRDLEIFLERDFLKDKESYGNLPRDSLETMLEYVQQTLDIEESQLPSLRGVMRRGQTMFERSRAKANKDAYKYVKEISASGGPSLVHPVFSSNEAPSDLQAAGRDKLLASIEAYQPHETIFEIGARGKQAAAQLMKQRRDTIARRRSQRASAPDDNAMDLDDSDVDNEKPLPRAIAILISIYLRSGWKRTEREGTTFAEQARSATLDLNADEGDAARAQKASQLKWDRKRKRFVKDAPGGDNKKMIRSESGALLPATFKSGKFADWKKSRRSRADHALGSEAQSGGLATAHSIVKERRIKEKVRPLSNTPTNSSVS
ncbi:hypothetical protein A1Q1_01444 [Trichosporon asahii var. asahii CBS 2479]|uniref:RNA helicase n=1 Tax=Trichosporon asahii var. asahii (strain ATCC 90039 / CBS 2479 / JCM 2466 / KCTC 7840 / NBRC 103889/ NCYC 2677 / UAMH 7654) TaxID=1186058 RepID=J6F2K2_TRIAS|nr:hypothetical protein A1Q1_01444 [Trichosporon asahii var. asahii CBS 2479]EJT49422.1 hypothetical protein A1Q1_01444 [Trichosporon asahii var. asahii CBS 2479]